MHVAELLCKAGAQVEGYVFFRTFWTKEVSRIYAEVLGRAEDVFGRVVEGQRE